MGPRYQRDSIFNLSVKQLPVPVGSSSSVRSRTPLRLEHCEPTGHPAFKGGMPPTPHAVSQYTYPIDVCVRPKSWSGTDTISIRVFATQASIRITN